MENQKGKKKGFRERERERERGASFYHSNMYKMHSNADSELTNITLSSPSRSPRRPEYFVQSPSHESTPAQSPARSPPHSYNYGASAAAADGHRRSLGHSSYTSRFSSSLPPASGGVGGGNSSKISPDDDKAWRRIIEEESLLGGYDEDERDRGTSCRFYVLTFVISFLVMFSMFALILWGGSHRQKPVITMKSIRFENFVVQAGTDASMVPTDLSTLNSTLKFTYRNTGSFFGVHVSLTPVKLYYYQLTMATGSIDNFYQKKKSERNITVTVAGNQIPLYGGGLGLSSNPSKGNVELVNMTLSFTMRSRAYVLGKLVKPKFYNNAQCLVTMDLNNLNKTIPLKNSCQYT